MAETIRLLDLHKIAQIDDDIMANQPSPLTYPPPLTWNEGLITGNPMMKSP